MTLNSLFTLPCLIAFILGGLFFTTVWSWVRHAGNKVASA